MNFDRGGDDLLVDFVFVHVILCGCVSLRVCDSVTLRQDDSSNAPSLVVIPCLKRARKGAEAQRFILCWLRFLACLHLCDFASRRLVERSVFGCHSVFEEGT